MNSLDPDFNWHVNGLYVALGPDNSVYTDTAATTGHGARASLLARTNKPWSRLQELGYSIQGYVQPATPQLYTCKGKGGSYELLGTARGAGTSRTAATLAIYRDTIVGAIYFRTLEDFETRMMRVTPKLVDVPDLPVVAEHLALTGDTADVVLADLPQNAMNCIDRAVDALLRARARNTVMQTKWVVGSDFWHANESIDDEIHNALAALGQ